MRRLFMVLGVMSLVVLVVAGVAIAANVTGTNQADCPLNGTNSNDNMAGLASADCVNAFAGDDNIETGAGNDASQGGTGFDQIFGSNGQDRLFGQDGDDTIYGGLGGDLLGGGSGSDFLVSADGIAGNDTINAGESEDDFDICVRDVNGDDDEVNDCERIVNVDVTP
jgi:Ca2+-binding RTX toxin-like protein